MPKHSLLPPQFLLQKSTHTTIKKCYWTYTMHKVEHVLGINQLLSGSGWTERFPTSRLWISEHFSTKFRFWSQNKLVFRLDSGQTSNVFRTRNRNLLGKCCASPLPFRESNLQPSEHDRVLHVRLRLCDCSVHIFLSWRFCGFLVFEFQRL